MNTLTFVRGIIESIHILFSKTNNIIVRANETDFVRFTNEIFHWGLPPQRAPAYARKIANRILVYECNLNLHRIVII